MKKSCVCVVAALVALALHVEVLKAESVSVTDGQSANTFGEVGGVAIDFNTDTASANWTDDLIAGQLYSVDSVSLFHAGGDLDADLYLGVYSSYEETPGPHGDNSTAIGALSGFLGVSDNTVNFSTGSDGDKLTWNFSGINVTAGSSAGNGLSDPIGVGPFSGDGVLFFAFQTDTIAVSTILSAGDGPTRIHRIDGGNGSFVDELAAILQPTNVGSNGGDSNTFKMDRSPEYEATVSLIPEPTSMALCGLGALAALCKRRRNA